MPAMRVAGRTQITPLGAAEDGNQADQIADH
jgi:hypothetical protein